MKKLFIIMAAYILTVSCNNEPASSESTSVSGDSANVQQEVVVDTLPSSDTTVKANARKAIRK
ncbi:MAG: hypothetical protein WKF97_16950 [Chitinophagaceae bacterium]